jgi:hypothetical protein
MWTLSPQGSSGTCVYGKKSGLNSGVNVQRCIRHVEGRGTRCSLCRRATSDDYDDNRINVAIDATNDVTRGNLRIPATTHSDGNERRDAADRRARPDPAVTHLRQRP